MTYSVKEIFYTLQGEGANAGRPAVFCRFAGCNLWSGREEDRSTAVCKFCDTDFVGTDGSGGGKFSNADQLASAVEAHWPNGSRLYRFIVITGGEPLLQLDQALIDALHQRNFEIAVETNGTLPMPAGIDWVCVSPKADAEIIVTKGHELKLVYPQAENWPGKFEHLEFQHFYLQPKDSADRAQNTFAAIEYCKANPKWRLSAQTHKMLGIP